MDTTQNPQLQTNTLPSQAVPSVVAVHVADNLSLTPAQVALVLAEAKEADQKIVDWVRALDLKISPLLSAAGALLAACLAILGQATSPLTARPTTHLLLIVTLLPLLYSLLMGASANSPTLKWSFFGNQRHKAEKPKLKPLSVLFFGHVALYRDSAAYGAVAKATFLDQAALLEDILDQAYINAKIAENKSTHIALATRGLIIAVGLMVVCAITFWLKF